MRSASLCAWFKELHFNFAAQPSLRAWLSCFFTGGTQRKTAAAAPRKHPIIKSFLYVGLFSLRKSTERSDNRKIIIHKKDCYTGQNPCTAVLFYKRKLTELFAAHETPACLRHSRTAGSAGIATHREALSTATPKRPAAESSVSKVLCISAQPGKQRDTACLHAPQAAFPSRTGLLKRGDPPLTAT